jgi:PAS domain-containing protein
MAIADQSLDLTATLRHLGLPSVIVSREGRITWMNDAARALFGDLVGQISLGTTVAPEHAALARREFERKLDGAPVSDYEVDVVTLDGRRVRAVISSVSIPGDDPDRAVFAVAWLEPQPPRVIAEDLTPRQKQVLDAASEAGSRTARGGQVDRTDRRGVAADDGDGAQSRSARAESARRPFPARGSGRRAPTRSHPGHLT